LDQTKSAVLNSLSSTDAQRGHIDEFIEWYCSEPRLSFTRSVDLFTFLNRELRIAAPRS
jgi:hypothetical protein